MIKIVIVDDNEDNLYMLESLLSSEKYSVLSARNGEEALQLVQTEMPDLIISDILMPVMDGYTLCRECKKDNTLCHIPFIFYTATYTNAKDEELAYHLGADRFLIKPQEPETIEMIIQEVLSESSNKKSKKKGVQNVDDSYVMKEYNAALVRKLEDKMLQAEKAQAELQHNNEQLKTEIIERVKAETLLRESEERFRCMYDEAVVGLYRTTLQGDIILANKALIKMLGFKSLEELRKRNLSEAGYADSYDRENFLEILLRDGEVVNLESRWIKSDGTEIHIRENAKVIREEDGTVRFIDGVVEDITRQKQAERALQESKVTFETLANVSPIGIFKTRPDGYTTYVNVKWTELSGLPFAAALGDNWLAAVHPDDVQKVVSNWHKDVGRTDTSSAEYRFLHPDGREVWVIGYAVPEVVQGVLVGYIGTITDVTELKQQEFRLRSLTRAVEQSPVSIIMTDIKGCIQYVNPQFELSTGYTSDEVLGENVRFLKSGLTDPIIYQELWDTIMKGETWRGEFYNKKKNGQLFWESAVISPILDGKGNIIQFLAVHEDITQRKNYEKELIIAKEKAEEMNRLKSSLLANMSHELRTPLISVLGYSELMKDGTYPDDIKKMGRHIHSGGERLLTTLNNLLQFSKIESKNIVPKYDPIDVTALLDDVADELEMEIMSRHLVMRKHYAGKVYKGVFDAVLLREIFHNLMQNAVKFTPKGSIDVCVTQNGDKLSIVFKDSGIGISKEQQKYIFDEFRQASEGYGRIYEGSGLGLTIAMKFAHILGGDISVESELGTGSVFTVTLPFREANTETQESRTPVVASTKIPDVLYVENDEVSVSIVTEFLTGICNVDFALNGNDALAKIKSRKYDLFLMDINLGKGIDGLEVTSAIRMLPHCKFTPIIAVTALAMQGDKEACLNAGCSSYISKPFDRQSLIELVRSSLKM